MTSQPTTNRDIIVDDLRVTYLERVAAEGMEHAPPLLMLHGIAAMAASFAGLIACLPPGPRIVALDLPGLPLPGAEVRDTSFASLVVLIQRVAAALEIRHPVLLGHSHGGALALHWAACHPGELRGLILISPAHPFSGFERPVVRFWNSLPGRLLARFGLPIVPLWLYAMAFRNILGAAGKARGIDPTPYWRQFRNRRLLRQIRPMVHCWTSDMAALGSRLDAHPPSLPVLLLWGECDTVVPLSTSDALRRRLPHAEQIVLHGTGHLPPEEEPEECARRIAAYLARPGLRQAC